MKDIFFAKSVLPNGSHPTVKDHCLAVSTLAGQFGGSFQMEKEAELAGLFHDFGKYSKVFQRVLTGKAQNIDHAICGATFLYHATKKRSQKWNAVVEAISGHHDGLMEIDLLLPQLEKNMKENEPVENRAGKASSLSGAESYREAAQQFREDFPAYCFPKISLSSSEDSSRVASMLNTRMLFSCLVDADYSVSAQDEDESYLSRTSLVWDPEALLRTLTEYRETIRIGSKSDGTLNRMRDAIYEQCGKMGDGPEGLYTLTAPTGTGKTLALLHFALRHCIANGKERIIIVLPYLTLTEQNADTYRKISPEVLEDHSQKNLTDAERDFSARWSANLLVTTSVQFFENLFSNKPTDCRKLHHIANSVVVFDEAQTLPAELTATTLQAVKELCQRYHTTMVFSTATQPEYDALPDLDWNPTEIIPNYAEFYRTLQRTWVEWRMEAPIPLEELAEEIAEQDNVCVIVNMKKHARKLYRCLFNLCPGEELFFITTDLCPEHRRQVIDRVKQCLEEKSPCRVVATQCIEAGVDFDFDVVYRALAPLDAIIQAAGRCNRNGTQTEKGRVIVFKPKEEEPLYPGNWYETAALKVEFLWKNRKGIDIHDPEDVRAYYQLLFREAKDKPSLRTAIKNRSFMDVEKEYRLINEWGVRIIVPFTSDYETIAKQVQECGITPAILRKAASITVSANSKDLEGHAVPLFYAKRGRVSQRASRFFLLAPQSHHLYTEDMGLQLPETKETIFFA